jgi:transposase-like protein
MTNLTDPIYHDADKAREHLEVLHWPDGPVCPRCHTGDRITKLAGKSTRPGVYKCNECAKPFTVTVGTIFEDSKIPLNKWLLAFRLLNGGKKGFSAHELHRSLGITYKSAWFMAHRIREAMKAEPNGPLGGPDKFVEADETFIGGKQRRNTRRVAPKKVVVSLVERGGEVRSFHFQRIHGSNIKALVFTNVDRASHLMTDQAGFYTTIGKEYASHKAVLHSIGEYVRGDAHSNTAENFFSIFKRGVIGTYHHLSEQHLHRYTAEFDFRYNTRKISDMERTEEALKGHLYT